MISSTHSSCAKQSQLDLSFKTHFDRVKASLNLPGEGGRYALCRSFHRFADADSRFTEMFVGGEEERRKRIKELSDSLQIFADTKRNTPPGSEISGNEMDYSSRRKLKVRSPRELLGELRRQRMQMGGVLTKDSELPLAVEKQVMTLPEVKRGTTINVQSDSISNILDTDESNSGEESEVNESGKDETSVASSPKLECATGKSVESKNDQMLAQLMNLFEVSRKMHCDLERLSQRRNSKRDSLEGSVQIKEASRAEVTTMSDEHFGVHLRLSRLLCSPFDFELLLSSIEPPFPSSEVFLISPNECVAFSSRRVRINALGAELIEGFNTRFPEALSKEELRWLKSWILEEECSGEEEGKDARRLIDRQKRRSAFVRSALSHPYWMPFDSTEGGEEVFRF